MKCEEHRGVEQNQTDITTQRKPVAKKESVELGVKKSLEVKGKSKEVQNKSKEVQNKSKEVQNKSKEVQNKSKESNPDELEKGESKIVSDKPNDGTNKPDNDSKETSAVDSKENTSVKGKRNSKKKSKAKKEIPAVLKKRAQNLLHAATLRDEQYLEPHNEKPKESVFGKSDNKTDGDKLEDQLKDTHSESSKSKNSLEFDKSKSVKSELGKGKSDKTSESVKPSKQTDGSKSEMENSSKSKNDKSSDKQTITKCNVKSNSSNTNELLETCKSEDNVRHNRSVSQSESDKSKSEVESNGIKSKAISETNKSEMKSKGNTYEAQSEGNQSKGINSEGNKSEGINSEGNKSEDNRSNGMEQCAGSKDDCECVVLDITKYINSDQKETDIHSANNQQLVPETLLPGKITPVVVCEIISPWCFIVTQVGDKLPELMENIW